MDPICLRRRSSISSPPPRLKRVGSGLSLLALSGSSSPVVSLSRGNSEPGSPREPHCNSVALLEEDLILHYLRKKLSHWSASDDEKENQGEKRRASEMGEDDPIPFLPRSVFRRRGAIGVDDLEHIHKAREFHLSRLKRIKV